jgi:hypothetical protein
MRISSRIGLIVIVVVIVAALIGLYVGVYLPQAAERTDLTQRRDTAQVLQSQLTTTRSDLESQLVSAQSQLDTSQTKFPEAIESIEYGEYVFEIVEECNLRLASLSFPKPTSLKQGSVTYSVVSLTLPVSGTVENIFKLIDIIKTDPRFDSTKVKSVNLNVAGDSATIAVDIYGYKG